MSSTSIEDIIEEDIRYMSCGLPPEGCRPAGSEFANRVGFTSERFDGYLWEHEKTCYLSLVISKQPGQGHFSEVLARLTDLGFAVKVPTPMLDMQAILTRKGFHPSEDDPLMWTQ